MPEPFRQLTDAEIKALGAACRPFEFPGPVPVDKHTLLSLINEAQYHRSQAGAGTLEIRSLVSLRDGLPRVTLQFGAVRVTLSIQETLDHAHRLLEVAAGAAADAFLVAFAAEKLPQLPAPARQALLYDFRQYRDTVLGLLKPDDLPLERPDDK